MEFKLSKTKCKGCNYPMTWADQKRQYGRLMELGFKKEEIKEIVPRCQKCTTVFLKEKPVAHG